MYSYIYARTIPEKDDDRNMKSNKDQKKKKPENEPKTFPQKLVDSLRDIVIVFAVFLLVYMLLFRVVVVEGSSMNKTLFNGDRLLLLSSSVYQDPKPGDIVVCSLKDFNDGKCIVKRVIAVEGQKVEVKDNKVYVDDVPLDEPYAVGVTTDSYDFAITVEPGCVYVLGDNREYSHDSRGLGRCIDKREILGKVLFLITPGKETGNGESDPGRIGVVK